MRSYSEAEGNLLEGLDTLEQDLLSFEGLVAEAGDWRPIVHSLFRTMHNMKSSLAMAGYAPLGDLSHLLESLLDTYRAGNAEPDSNSAALLLDSIDEIRACIQAGPEHLADYTTKIQALNLRIQEQQDKTLKAETTYPKKQEKPIFLLNTAEYVSLCNALDSKHTTWVLEKLISGNTAPAQDGTLPIFTTIRSLGKLITWTISAASSSEQILRILFTSSLQKKELDFELFDPFYSIDPDSIPHATECADVLPKIPRILIVDDDPISIVLLQLYLSPFGRIDSAVSGKEAMERFATAFQNDPYSVVLLDIMMPELDGQDVLQRIRKIEDEGNILLGSGCKIIMQSALSDFATISSSFSNQCDAYIVKPYERKEVYEAMAKIGYFPLKLGAN